MAKIVRVWALPDLQAQHAAAPPEDEVTKEWEGTTACDITATLRWIHNEVVDAGMACEACHAVTGRTPPLEGEDLGPV
jgi:hypothetical protein